MSRSSNRTFPSARASGMVSCRRLRQRRNVDLPHPEGPMIAVTSRSRSGMETLRMAADAPKYAVRPSASRRARPLSGERRSVAGAGADFRSRDKAGSDTDDKDHTDEDEGAGPGEPMPFVVRTDCIGKDLQRKRSDRLVELNGPEVISKRGEQKRSGLTGDARDRDEHAGHDASGGGSQDYRERRARA